MLAGFADPRRIAILGKRPRCVRSLNVAIIAWVAVVVISINKRANTNIIMMEWLLYGLLALVTGLALLIISPRFKGGKDAPPVVTHSSVVPIPLIGVIAEFFKSPNTMIKRCYKDYGPVFTIPVCTHVLCGMQAFS